MLVDFQGVALVNSQMLVDFQGVAPKENFPFVHDAKKKDETPVEGAHAVPPITTSQ